MAAINAHLARKDGKAFVARELPNLVGKIDVYLVEALADTFSNHVRLPGHLVTTDRVLQRWAAAPTGSPAQDEDVYRECRPPPLDPRTQEVVSDQVKAAPSGVRSFVVGWYCCTWLSVKEMARQRHMSRRQLDREKLDVLHVVRAGFLASPHADLVRLVRESA